MNEQPATNRLSLWQRERIEVRDCSPCVFQAPTRCSAGRCPVLLGSGDSKIERRQFPGWREIFLERDRVSPENDSRDLSHPVRSQVLRRDNRNRACRGEWDVGAGICSPRSYDFAGGAREYVHIRSCVSGDSGRVTFGNLLGLCRSGARKFPVPLTSILSPQRGRGGCAAT